MLRYWVKDKGREKHIQKMYNKGYVMFGADRYADWTKITWGRR